MYNFCTGAGIMWSILFTIMGIIFATGPASATYMFQAQRPKSTGYSITKSDAIFSARRLLDSNSKVASGVNQAFDSIDGAQRGRKLAYMFGPIDVHKFSGYNPGSQLGGFVKHYPGQTFPWEETRAVKKENPQLEKKVHEHGTETYVDIDAHVQGKKGDKTFLDLTEATLYTKGRKGGNYYEQYTHNPNSYIHIEGDGIIEKDSRYLHDAMVHSDGQQGYIKNDIHHSTHAKSNPHDKNQITESHQLQSGGHFHSDKGSKGDLGFKIDAYTSGNEETSSDMHVDMMAGVHKKVENGPKATPLAGDVIRKGFGNFFGRG